MKHIFRVPVDVEHFKDTIIEGKPYTEILPFFPAEDMLKSIMQGGTIHYWGSQPGQSNLKTFNKLAEGDELLCYRSGKYVAVATIAFSLVSPALARYSWGETKDKTTWELIYFLKNVRLIDIQATAISEALGYKSGLVMGFSMVSEETADQFIKAHGSVAKFIESLKVTP